MSEPFKRTISTADFTETPRLTLEQATGDVHMEGWDRPDIEITTSDEDEYFDVELSGSQVIVRSKPLKFAIGNIGDAWRPAVNDLQTMGIDLEKMAARVERKVARSLRHVGHRIGHVEGNINLGRWVGGRDYYIKVPYSCDLALRTSTGDLAVSGVNGTHFIQSTAGDTQLSKLSGNVLVSSASGDIHIEGVEGKLGIRSASGDIAVDRATLQELSASTASGDVELELLNVPEREFETKSVSGDVNVKLPSDARVTVEVSTFSGDLNCSLPHEKQRQGGRNTRLLINGGGSMARMSSVSGDINIERGRANGDGGSNTMDLSRAPQPEGNWTASSGEEDRKEPEGYAERKQKELEILQALEKGEITSQEAMNRLNDLGG